MSLIRPPDAARAPRAIRPAGARGRDGRRVDAVGGRPLVLAAATALAGTAWAALPDDAAAHGLVGREDLPLPSWLFAWGAAVVLVVSFVALTALWRRPRLERAPERRLARVPAALEVSAGAIGIAVFAAVAYAGFAGAQTATANLAPTVVYVVFWVAIPLASALVGDVFTAFNPWRAAARGLAWAARRGGGRTRGPRPYPAWLGRWPATLTILAFAWLELVCVDRDQPSVLALVAVAYAGAQLFGMSRYGIEPWTGNADGFSVYFRLFAMLSPLRWHARVLRARPPLAGAPALNAVPGTVPLLCAMIGTTSFDGLSHGALWAGTGGIAAKLQERFAGLGVSHQAALELTSTIGLLSTVALVGALYRVGAAGMATVGADRDPVALGRRFAHSLIPIALAYVVAHYFSLLAYQGQAVAALASDPLGRGSDLFGTASVTIDYGVISATGVWYVQVAALVLGHVCGLALAHDRALVSYRRVVDATHSQYWMLTVMVAFTSLGLWLLSASAQP